MPPKPKGKDDKKKGEEQAVDDGAERELVEKELVISYLKSRLGRHVAEVRVWLMQQPAAVRGRAAVAGLHGGADGLQAQESTHMHSVQHPRCLACMRAGIRNSVTDCRWTISS